MTPDEAINISRELSLRASLIEAMIQKMRDGGVTPDDVFDLHSLTCRVSVYSLTLARIADEPEAHGFRNAIDTARQ
jgi:hypothetical protein